MNPAACRLVAGLTILLLLAAAPLSALAQHAFRIDPGHAESVAELREAAFARDYGGYLWIEGGAGLEDELRAAGINFQAQPEAVFQLQVHRNRFDPVRLNTPFAGEAGRGDGGQRLGLVQFRGPILADDLAALREAGLEPIQYYPGFGYLVWGEGWALEQARGLAQVRWSGEFARHLRIEPGLKARGGWISNVNVHAYNDGDPGRVAAALEAVGAEVLDFWAAQPDRRIYDFKIRADAADLDRLASIAQVISLNFMSPEPQLEDESATQVLAGNLDASNIPFPGYMSWLTDIGLDGSGVIWATTDSGVWYDHPDYGSRVVGGTSYPGCTAVPNPGDERPAGGGHGTHVSGIYGGDGTGGFTDSDGFLYGLGMAPGVSIYAQNPICGTQSSWPPAGGWSVLSRDALSGGAIGSNNSWTSGEGTQHGYQNSERTYDLMVLDGNFDSPQMEPFNVVFSAGNSGQAGITAPKEAKNVVVTGGTQTFRVSGNVDAIYGSSSRGPAVDGRWLPTITAPAQSVSSSIKPGATSCTQVISGTGGLYSFCTGTSMAAPHASGAVILLSEWWRDANAGADFNPAMGKALLINSAVRLQTSVPPNNDIGWGRIDLSTIVDQGLVFEFWDQDELFTASGQAWTRTVGVVDPSRPLKVTLVWSDAPGAVGANPALVNDLDLSVDSGGQVYLGNVFEGGWSVTGGEPDRLNNIEQVVIENPGGAATITIDAFQIAGSVLLDQPAVDTAQHFALVCQNCLEQPDYTLAVSPDAAEFCAPDQAQFEVQVGALLGFDDPVALTAQDLPAGVTGLFSEPVVIPPGSSTLEIDVTAGASLGHFEARVEGSSTSGTRSRSIALGIFDAEPGTVALLTPEADAFNTDRDPVFSWAAADQAGSYLLEVDTDPGFSDPVLAVETTETSFQPATLLASSTEYHWRVTVNNACGSEASATRSFVTRPEPGDCPLGADTLVLFEDDIEDGAGDWIVSTEGIGNTWAISDVRSFSGNFSWHANAPASISDQRLISPAVQLPGAEQLPLTLRFQNYQHIESASAGNCWDAVILEISSDDGESWEQVEDALLLTQPYDGTVNNFASGPNPLTGRDAWCGDPVDWTDNVADLSDWAGENIRLRFRLGTDSIVGREGWYVDDVRVEACGTFSEVIFADAFESDL